MHGLQLILAILLYKFDENSSLIDDLTSWYNWLLFWTTLCALYSYDSLGAYSTQAVNLIYSSLFARNGSIKH